eukprot:513582-Rhodomonas_salina.1
MKLDLPTPGGPEMPMRSVLLPLLSFSAARACSVLFRICARHKHRMSAKAKGKEGEMIEAKGVWHERERER